MTIFSDKVDGAYMEKFCHHFNINLVEILKFATIVRTNSWVKYPTIKTRPTLLYKANGDGTGHIGFWNR